MSWNVLKTVHFSMILNFVGWIQKKYRSFDIWLE